MSTQEIVKVNDIDFKNFTTYLDFTRNLIAKDGSIIIDLSEIKRCNSAAICILLAAQRECNSKNCKIRFIYPKETNQLSKLLTLYNLDQFFS